MRGAMKLILKPLDTKYFPSLTEKLETMRPVGTNQPLPETEEDIETKLKEAFSRGWNVVVWNDPINLMDYVVFVFKTVLKMADSKAYTHMMEVHTQGKSVVSQETKEKSELIVHRLRAFGLNATMEPNS